MRPTPIGMERLANTPHALAASPRAGREAGGVRSAMPLTGVILNPRSHRNQAALPDIPHDANVLCVVPRSKPELEAALADFARRHIEVLAIGGGDGTVRDVLTRAAPIFGEDWPAIALLPKGKTNALALDLGVPAKWPLADALASAQAGRMVTRRPLSIERLDAPQRRRLGFILGAGVFNAAIDAGQVAHKAGAFQNFAVGLTALFGVGQALFGFGKSPWRKIWPMQIGVGAEQAPLAHSGRGDAAGRYFTTFSTLTTLPPGVRPFASTDAEGGIRFLILDAPSRRAVMLLPAAALGYDWNVMEQVGLLRGGADEFRLDLDDGFILDGERFPAGSYRVTLGPELRFVVP